MHLFRFKLLFVTFLICGLSFWACRPSGPVALNSDQNELEKQIQLADSFFLHNQIPEALAPTLAVLRAMPLHESGKRLDWQNRLWRIYFKLGYARAADSLLQRCHQDVMRTGAQAGARAAFWANAGTALLAQQPDSAWACLERALELDSARTAITARAALNLAWLSANVYGDEALAQSYYQQALRPGMNAPDMDAPVLMAVAGWLSRQERITQAAEWFGEARRRLRRCGLPGDTLQAWACLHEANILHRLGRVSQAKQLYDEAIAGFKPYGSQAALRTAYQKLALALADLKEREAARDYLAKSLADIGQIADPEARAGMYLDAAETCAGLGDTLKTIEYTALALGSVWRWQTGSIPEIPELNLLAVHHYLSVGAYQQAENCFRGFSPPMNPEPALRYAYYNANIHMQRRDFHNVLLQCREGEIAAVKAGIRRGLFLAGLYLQAASAHAALGQAPRALESVQKGITAASDEKGDRLHAPQMLDLLREKAAILQQLYRRSRRSAFLNDALLSLQQAQALAADIRGGLEAAESKFSLSEQLYPLYEQSISAAMELYRATGSDSALAFAFETAHRSRAAVLAEALQSRRAGREAGLPDSVLDALDAAPRKLAALQQQLQQQASAAGADSIRKNIFQTREQWRRSMRRIEALYPGYYHMRFQPDVPAAGEVQAWLAAQQSALLTFFCGDSSWHVFAMDGQGIEVQSLRPDSALYGALRQFRAGLSENPAITARPVDVAAAGYALWQRLLAPLAHRFSSARLIIAPDGPLCYIPFEALPTQAPAGKGFKSLAYFFQQKRLHYTYSTSLMLSPPEEPGQAGAGLALFAPAFGAEIAALPYAEAEARRIASQTGGRLFMGVAATEAAFRTAATHYAVLHLATHTDLNDAQPMYARLRFAHDEQNDGALHAYEILPLRLSAQLAVLSACNTGDGLHRRGEGVMSLARSFAQAGVPAIVMTLWPAQDQAASQLMDHFYASLARQLPADEALDRARTAYLQSASELSAHPYYWGGFVLAGDPSPVMLKGKGTGVWYWLLPLLLLAGAGLWYIRAKNHRRPAQLSKSNSTLP